MLNNLSILSKEVQKKYNEEFDSNEIVLSKEFKEAYENYLHKNSQDISYSRYTATITSSGNLKMYIPNQWFNAASFMIPYIIELVKYKRLIEEILSLHFNSANEKKKYIKEMKNTEDQERIDEFREWAEEYFSKLDDVESNDVEYVTLFISNYEWWAGNKTIDRGDYYVSPILSLLGVVNVSQSYIADISYILATNLNLTEASLSMSRKNTQHDMFVCENTIYNVKNQKTMRKTGGINLIVYGAPGTGKSSFLKEQYGGAPFTRRVVFHSEYSYYDFIGVYKPVPLYKESTEIFKSLDGQVYENGEPYIDYKFVPGPFTKTLIDAWLDPTSMYTLLIEEINRADAAAVFGEVFQLLDRKLDGTSEYLFEPSDDLKRYLLSIEELRPVISKGVMIPSNMNIVATMNSADQGVKPMDSAFKRRWNFQYMKINISGAVHEKAELLYAGRKVYWGKLVELINRKLLHGKIRVEEDKLIGPYYIKPEEVGKKRAIDKLLLYLWDDVFRHSRDIFFNSEVHSFAELSEKFESIDVLNLLCDDGNDEFMSVPVYSDDVEVSIDVEE